MRGALRDLNLDPFGQLDWIRAHGLEGAQFGGLGADRGLLRELPTHADAMRGLMEQAIAAKHE